MRIYNICKGMDAKKDTCSHTGELERSTLPRAPQAI